MAKKTKAEIKALIKKKEEEIDALQERIGETYGDPVVTLH